MKRKRDRTRVPVDVIDGLPWGGHDLEQLPDVSTEEDYWYRCDGCHGRVAGSVLESDTWQLTIGAYCPKILMGV